MNLLTYFIKVTALSGILYSYYILFLRNKKIHQFNRFYLLATNILPIILALVSVPVHLFSGNINSYPVKILSVINKSSWEPGISGSIQTHLVSPGLNWQLLAFIIYAVISIMIFYTLLKSFIYIMSLCRKYQYEWINGIQLFHTSEPNTPFSFFNKVFWDSRLNRNSSQGKPIFRHEYYHVRERHSLDILLCEIIGVLFWFNPFFFLARKEIKIIQEFLADRYAVSATDRHNYAQLLVAHSIQGRQLALSHYFFTKPIKRRITMITQTQNTRFNYLSRIMVLPLFIILTCAFTIKINKTANAPFSKSKDKITILVDAGHGGTDAGTTVGSLVEKNINLAIAKKIQLLAKDYNVNVVMSRDGDYLPGNAKDIREGLENRVKLSEKVKADLFLSIHINADNDDNTRNGVQVVVSADDRKNIYQEKSKLLGSTIVASLKKTLPVDENILQATAGVYILDHASCPAVIIECSYITNKNDRAFIVEDKNQTAIAKNILEGALQFENNSKQ